MVRAIYEDNVFRPPVEPVDLPERCQVEFEPRVVGDERMPSLDDVYAVLNERFESGESDVAARHNEHQP